MNLFRSVSLINKFINLQEKAFQLPGFLIIDCHIKGNTGSSNVSKKLGFKEIGECEEFFLSRGKVMPTVTLQLNF